MKKKQPDLKDLPALNSKIKVQYKTTGEWDLRRDIPLVCVGCGRDIIKGGYLVGWVSICTKCYIDALKVKVKAK